MEPVSQLSPWWGAVSAVTFTFAVYVFSLSLIQEAKAYLEGQHGAGRQLALTITVLVLMTFAMTVLTSGNLFQILLDRAVGEK